MSQRQLTDDEQAICRQLGVSKAEYLAAEQAERLTSLCRESAGTLAEAKEKIRRLMGVSAEGAEKLQAEAEKKAEAQKSLTEEELEACRLLGVEPLEFWAAKMKEAGLKPVV